MADTRPADPHALLDLAEEAFERGDRYQAAGYAADYVLWRALHVTTSAVEERYDRIMARLIGHPRQERQFVCGIPEPKPRGRPRGSKNKKTQAP